jgi:hypothetical protein
MKKWNESVGVAIVWLGAATMATAGEYGWDGGGDGTNWSSGANWAPDAPAGGPSASDIVHHNTVGQTAEITVDQNVTIANARVKWDEAASSVGSAWTANWTGDGTGRTVNVTQSLEVMYGRGTGTPPPHINATLNLSNLHLALGTESQPADLAVARRTSSTVDNVHSHGTLTVSGGSVTAYLDHFVIGRNLGGTGGAGGTVNLSGCTNVMIDLDGTAYLGARVDEDQASYNVGTFRSGGGSVNVSEDLVLADSNDSSGNETGNGSSGKLFLENTTFTVGGQALFYGAHKETVHQRRFSQVDTTVAGRPSGLDLANSAPEALSFPFGHQNNSTDSTYNLIDIKFTADPTETDAGHWYWGMRWAGNHESVIEGYRGEDYPRLKLDVSGLSDAVKRRHLRYLKQKWPGTYGAYTGIGDLQPNDYIVFDDDALGGTGYTYVGVCAPPPAGTVFMMR